MRLFTGLIGLGLALGFSTGVAAQFTAGDINDDGFFDIRDTVVLRRALYDLEPGIAQLCGNGDVDPGEDCEVGDLNGATCADEGFLFGTLACGPGCVFDTSGCTNTRFVDNGDGTVTDNQTGLMWEKKVSDIPTCFSGAPSCTFNVYAWADAMGDWISELNGFTADPNAQSGLAGHGDWRLPTVGELMTILLMPYLCGTNPCIDPIFGPTGGATVGSNYWSATTHTSFLDGAWVVNFNGGFVGILTKPFETYVRAVRGGP